MGGGILRLVKFKRGCTYLIFSAIANKRDQIAVHNSTDERVTEKQKVPMSENESVSNDCSRNDYSDQRQAVSRYGEKENSRSMTNSPPDALQSKERFDALVRDRDSLRAEVTDMRRSLEEIQSKHRADMEALQHKLNDAEGKKEHAESQFQKLLERVNTIKSQLGERLKEDAVRPSTFTQNR